MKPTDTQNPDYFHKVVDCQWACPAHTNVPEYIRMIAQGRFSDAYMVNRESNVFPGILGRTCDRPCEPACRRERVDGKPVAICRLKRVAADHRDDISDRLPKIPTAKNGKRIACIGAGPASLTVANDLMPLGYEVTIFEAMDKPGGLMRSNIPSFRLPAHVLDEEIAMIVDMGVDVRYNSPVRSLKGLLNGDQSAVGLNGINPSSNNKSNSKRANAISPYEFEKFDAIFVGSGAPRGKDLELPGRKEAAANIHIGIDWLFSIAFEHIKSIGERVLIIGVGNTAMDCCRSSRRLGGKDIKVMARRPRKYFKASPWELEDAEEEGIEIVVNHSPKRFVIENGKLVGMEFERVEWNEGATESRIIDSVIIPCDDVILAIGQDNAFPWIERDLGIEFGKWDMPKVDEKTHMSTRPGVFFGGDAAWGPKNIIWAVEHGHQAAISIHNHCNEVPVTERPARGKNLVSVKMGLSEWSYHNNYDPAMRQKMTHVDLVERFKNLTTEVELGFNAEQTAHEVQRCLNCDMETVFFAPKCIECDACIDICPVQCLTITRDAPDENELRKHLSAPATNLDQALFVSEALKQTGRLMVKDEDICVHCGLCAERCPTFAWDMQKFDAIIPKAIDMKDLVMA
ncbi:MAG: FAD-dependent oxidoreductase [Bacteroidota bacterium]|nr:FAD-dependent oxidoreductase [Bacteroidota bacterium]MDP4232147.1 FAD-dependent oxidoreductase [Bacteroidota bacterium]MDP4241145.1 FAD-dependent oxidoreductase [Bacteroidota bacterium]MDP4286537.1 FAD-dependent oxidoreductase [Bacteroidota bacterium]